jgi:hypothetical protein
MAQVKTWSTDNITGGDVAAGGMNIASKLMKGDAILSGGRFDEKQQLFNAGLADQAAADSLLKGDRQVDEIRRKTKQLVGEQRAAFAAQGIEINDGTAADVQEDTQYWGVMDELTAKNNAFLESYGYKMQALNLRTQAEMTRISTDFKYRMTLVEAGMEGAKAYATAGVG